MINVRNNRKSLVTLAGTTGSARLVPGENDIDPELWAELAARDGVKELLDAGTLQVVDGKAKPLPTKASAKDRARAHGRRVDELKDFDAPQVKDILADVDDEALLEAWAEDDRKEIRGLVRKRLRAVKKANR